MCVVMLTIGATAGRAATLPAGFTEALVASGLNNPTAMQFAPDGRLFVCEQGGRLRVIKNGALLSTPFLTVTVSSSGERGLLGVAFDPNFAVNQFVYVYYTATSPTVHNRVSRFTASGDVAAAGSEVVLLDLDNLSSATNHNGGALNFGPDGKLYVAVGENANAANAQTLVEPARQGAPPEQPTAPFPTDNPFYTSATGKNRAIWALGLRNPFTFAFSPSGSSMFINDVGQIDLGRDQRRRAAARTTAGRTPKARRPIRASPARATATRTPAAPAPSPAARSTRPPRAQFPSDYLNDYFFADYCAGWIRRLDPANGNAVTTFATGIASPVDLKVSEDGSLYYLARVSGGDDRRRLSRQLRRDCADDHLAAVEPQRRAGNVGHLQRPRLRPGAAAVSVAAQRRQHLGRDLAGLHDRVGRARLTTARASAPSSRTTPAAPPAPRPC